MRAKYHNHNSHTGPQQILRSGRHSHRHKNRETNCRGLLATIPRSVEDSPTRSRRALLALTGSSRRRRREACRLPLIHAVRGLVQDERPDLRRKSMDLFSKSYSVNHARSALLRPAQLHLLALCASVSSSCSSCSASWRRTIAASSRALFVAPVPRSMPRRALAQRAAPTQTTTADACAAALAPLSAAQGPPTVRALPYSQRPIIGSARSGRLSNELQHHATASLHGRPAAAATGIHDVHQLRLSKAPTN